MYKSVIFRNFVSYLRHDTKVAIVYTNLYLCRDNIKLNHKMRAIAKKYKKLKASEIMLFFFNFKDGFYERFYGYFDTQTIIRSFELFLQERHKIIQRYEALIEEIRNKKGKDRDYLLKKSIKIISKQRH